MHRLSFRLYLKFESVSCPINLWTRISKYFDCRLLLLPCHLDSAFFQHSGPYCMFMFVVVVFYLSSLELATPLELHFCVDTYFFVAQNTFALSLYMFLCLSSLAIVNS